MSESTTGRRPRRTRSRVLAGVAAVLAVAGIGIGAGAAGLFGGSTPASLPAPPPVSSSPASPPMDPAPAPAAPPRRDGAPMAESEPVRVRIPALGVDSELMDLGLQPDGTMEVPPGAFPAGWYTKAPSPGELGPAIIAGHVDWAGTPGVFHDLRELQPGDEVTVPREDGTTAVFAVDRVEQYPKDEFPTDEVYGDLDHAGLRLITCGGDYDASARSYDDNIVAYARLVDPGTT